MRERCYWSCEPRSLEKAESTGWRATFYYPAGGTYRGYWLRSQHQNYGVKTTKSQLIYDGQWQQGKRHGHGTLRRRLPNGTAERIYVGEWRNDAKCGEGKQFYDDGVYYGWWRNNRRDGLGIKWFKDGSIYLGEWQADVQHGVGVFYAGYQYPAPHYPAASSKLFVITVNGNRYEGNFARGFKNGEGTFFHNHTGQKQKGMWENDVCKTSLVMDKSTIRQKADRATSYPIPKCTLAEPDKFIRQLFQKYMPNANKPNKSFNELACLNFVRKMKRYAKFEPKAVSESRISFDDISYPCTCKKPEPVVCLRAL